MCCDDFWKKITVFSITLLIGFFAAELFRFSIVKCTRFPAALEQINSSDLQKYSPMLPQSKRKNCVPADSNLQYRNLPYDGSETSTVELKRRVVIIQEIASLKLQVENLEKSDQTKISRLKKEIALLEKLLKTPDFDLEMSDSYPEMQKLIYIEKCSEYGESMKVVPIVPTGK